METWVWKGSRPSSTWQYSKSAAGWRYSCWCSKQQTWGSTRRSCNVITCKRHNPEATPSESRPYPTSKQRKSGSKGPASHSGRQHWTVVAVAEQKLSGLLALLATTMGRPTAPGALPSTMVDVGQEDPCATPRGGATAEREELGKARADLLLVPGMESQVQATDKKFVELTGSPGPAGTLAEVNRNKLMDNASANEKWVARALEEVGSKIKEHEDALKELRSQKEVIDAKMQEASVFVKKAIDLLAEDGPWETWGIAGDIPQWATRRAICLVHCPRGGCRDSPMFSHGCQQMLGRYRVQYDGFIASAKPPESSMSIEQWYWYSMTMRLCTAVSAPLPRTEAEGGTVSVQGSDTDFEPTAPAKSNHRATPY